MFKNKKILILGFAREGASTLAYLRSSGNNGLITIYDKRGLAEMDKKWQEVIKQDPNYRLFLGQEIKDFLAQNGAEYDIIFKTAGIPNKLIPPKLLPKITTQTNIFLAKCQGTVIGVTGTKGKSTTSSLLYEMLKKSGRKTILVGNIGKPCLDLLSKTDNKTTVIFEMSSHQLSTLKKSPHIAVFLNIFPEHLDYYCDFADYIKAKTTITKYQKSTDILIYNGENKKVVEIAESSKAGLFDYAKMKINIGINETKLKGVHNLSNIKAVFQVGRVLNIDDAVIREAVTGFSPLRHRLEFVGKVNGVSFYNDSLATIPEATIGALDALGDEVATLITGGFNRGLSYTELAKRILESRIKTLILFPTTGKIIWKEMLKISDQKSIGIKHHFVDTMEKAVALSCKNTKKGKICLLSCASSSFNLFKDYQDRGDQFVKEVMDKSGKPGL